MKGTREVIVMTSFTGPRLAAVAAVVGSSLVIGAGAPITAKQRVTVLARLGRRHQHPRRWQLAQLRAAGYELAIRGRLE
jgi:hypothetical protein